jgi:hypothetical protein
MKGLDRAYSYMISDTEFKLRESWLVFHQLTVRKVMTLHILLQHDALIVKIV